MDVDDVLQTIFELLPLRGRAGARLVCRRWTMILASPGLWPELAVHWGGDEFARACGRGWSDAARWLRTIVWGPGQTKPLASCGPECGWPRDEPCDGPHDDPRCDAHRVALGGACAHGHLSTAQWLASVHDYAPMWPALLAILADACAGGHYAVVVWLATHYAIHVGSPGLGPGALERERLVAVVLAAVAEPAQADAAAVRVAARWIVERLALHYGDARGWLMAQSLLDRCLAADLAAMVRLAHVFGLSRADAHELGAAGMFVQAVSSGSLAVARWVAHTFGLERASFATMLGRDEQNRVLSYGACAGGLPRPSSILLMRWLVRRFDAWDATDVLRSGALETACGVEDIPVAVWLITHYGLTRRMICDDADLGTWRDDARMCLRTVMPVNDGSSTSDDSDDGHTCVCRECGRHM